MKAILLLALFCQSPDLDMSGRDVPQYVHLDMSGKTYADLDMGGQVKADVKPQPKKVATGYPVHRMQWNVEGDWNPSREKLLRHLQSSGNHRSKFPESWLETLTRDQLWSLHDDDHNGRVQWQYVPGRSSRSTTQVKPAATVCPT